MLIGALPAARMLDNCAHGGIIILGCFNVLIGEAGGGGGDAGGTQHRQPAIDRRQPRISRHDLPGRARSVREGNSFIVTFTDRDAPLGGHGSPGKRPGYQVELDRATLRVLSSSFMR